jgi:hypothetical protein
MHPKDIIKDLYALCLFAYAELLAFIIIATFDTEQLETKAYYMLLIFIGGLVCHTMVKAVHAIYRDTEGAAAAHSLTTAAGPV